MFQYNFANICIGGHISMSIGDVTDRVDAIDYGRHFRRVKIVFFGLFRQYLDFQKEL